MGGIAYTSTTFEKVRMLRQAMTGWKLKFLPKGSVIAESQLTVVDIAGAAITKIRFGQKLHHEGNTPSKTLSVAVSGDAMTNAYWGGMKVGQDDVLLFPPQAPYQALNAAASTLWIATVNDDLITDVATWTHTTEALDRLRNPEQLVIRPTGVHTADLRRIMRMVIEAAASEQAVFRLDMISEKIAAELARLMLEAVSANPSTGESKQVRALRKLYASTRAFTFAHLDEPLSVLDLCSRTGQPVERLDAAFQKFTGLSTEQFLQSLRFAVARRRHRLSRVDRSMIPSIGSPSSKTSTMQTATATHPPKKVLPTMIACSA